MAGTQFLLHVVTLAICLRSMQVQAELCPESPDTCQCVLTPGEMLQINCTERHDVTASIDVMLTNNTHLDGIAIFGSGLRTIPAKLCFLSGLKALELTNNSLESLDPECFKSLSKLEVVILDQNNLVDVPDHIFDSNKFLKQVSFNQNKISSIGLHVFANASNLKDLENIGLSGNLLKSLEPWPLVRMNARETIIDLRDNCIEKLTNELNLSYSCDMGSVSGTLQLQDNNLSRFSDFQYGWNVSNPCSSTCIWSTTVRFEIQENQYHCDCMETKWIQCFRDLQALSDIFRELRCHTPHFPDLAEPYPRVVAVPPRMLTCTKQCYEGQCTCTEIPYNDTYRVQCKDQAALPKELPKPYWNVDYKLVLEYQQNLIELLPARSYMDKVTSLDVSNNRITDVEVLVFLYLEKAEIKLEGNHLTRLPKELVDQHYPPLTGQISLHDNPWNCSCQNAWLQKWMLQLKYHLQRPNTVQCGSPSWLKGSQLLTANFCKADPNTKQQHPLIAVTIGSLTGVLLLLFASLLILYKARIWIFTRFHIHIFNEWDDTLDGRYDAFMSFAWDDYHQVKTVIDFLEDEHNFPCCIHNRDFHPGERFMDQMGAGIDQSRRTLCFVSPSFLSSTYCVWELKYALEEDVCRGKKRLVVIMLEPISEFDQSNQVVKQYISSRTYLDINDPDFASKLLYIMPSQPVQEDIANDQTSVNVSTRSISENTPLLP